MKRAADMFEKPVRTRSKANMYPIDAGPGMGGQLMALMECPKCSHDGGWWDFDTMTEAKRGVPCPKYNPCPHPGCGTPTTPGPCAFEACPRREK